MMQAGDYVIYQNGDRFELGLVKRLRPDGGAFVYYHEGDTAAGTPKECLHEIANAYTIKETTLGGHGDWIYTADSLPEDAGEYYLALRSLVSNRANWIAKCFYWPDASPCLGDELPLVRWGEAEVYAWRPVIWPEAPEEKEESR